MTAAGDSLETITTFTVPGTDGRQRLAVLVHPGTPGPVPLVLSPPPMGLTATANLFGSAAGRRTEMAFPGIWPAALERGAAVLTLESFGARLPVASLGWPAHVGAYATAVQHARTLVAVDGTRIVACGISMGGLESLLLAGSLAPLISAVAVQNAPVDLTVLHATLRADAEFADTLNLLETEVGGDPVTRPERYLERGAARHLAALARIPVHLRLNDLDQLVVASAQGRALAAALAAAGGRVAVHDDQPDVPPGAGISRTAHEHVDWPALLDFVLRG